MKENFLRKSLLTTKWVLLALVFSSIIAFAASAATQDVVLTTANGQATVGSSFLVNVAYSTSDDDKTATTIGIRVHYNSKKVSFSSFDNIFGTPTGTQEDNADTEDYDNDETTDMYALIGYFDFSGNWPGSSVTFPLTLTDLNFTAKSEAYNGEANFKVSFSTQDASFDPATGGEVVIVDITGGKDAPLTPVLSPVSSYSNSAVAVTATVDLNPIVTYYTIDGSTPDASTLTQYTGTAITVDGADTDIITVKMKSHDPDENVWSDEVGSAVYTFDKAVPVAAITAPATNGFVDETTLPISGTASDVTSGVASVDVSIDDQGSWNAATLNGTNWTYSATLAEGENAIAVRVIDNAGNETIETGSTITYYPPLALFVGGVDVTDGTVYVPNKAGINTKDIVVSGGIGGDFSTYTWALSDEDEGALTGASDTRTYTAIVDANGTATLTVTDSTDPAVFTASTEIKVVDFSASSNVPVGYVGSPVVFTAVGNTGNVSWAVTTNGEITGEPALSGDNNTVATITPVAPGDFVLTVTDDQTSTAIPLDAFTVYPVPDFSGLPEETEEIVYVPGTPLEYTYTVSGGDGTYTWTVTNPDGTKAVEGNDATFSFTPTTGNFAGDYTITVAESDANDSATFTIYVPLTIDPTVTEITILSNAAGQPFTLTGAADGTHYTPTVVSIDDELTYTPVTAVFSGNTAVYDFVPSGYSMTTGEIQDYSLDFDVEGLVAPEQVIMSIVPVTPTPFAGIIVDSNGVKIDGATVTITSPAIYKGTEIVTTDTGAFSLGPLNIVNNEVVSFKVVADGYLARSFDSTDLAETGDTEIILVTSGSSISGSVSNHDDNPIFVTLLDSDGVVEGPLEFTPPDFKFELSTVWSEAVDYTITVTGTSDVAGVTSSASKAITADAAVYTVPAAIDLVDDDPVDPADYTGDDVPATNTLLDSAKGGPVVVVAGVTIYVIAPVENGGLIKVVDPVPVDKSLTDTTLSISSGTQYQIGHDAGDEVCATLRLDVSLEDYIALQNRESSVYILHSDDLTARPIVFGSPTEIKTAGLEFNRDAAGYFVTFKNCKWSGIVAGVGVASPTSTSGTSSDSSDCFIGSLSASGSTGAMMAWISIAIILAAGIVLRTKKKRNLNYIE